MPENGYRATTRRRHSANSWRELRDCVHAFAAEPRDNLKNADWRTHIEPLLVAANTIGPRKGEARAKQAGQISLPAHPHDL
jgi:hypothetical protein